MSDNEGQSGSVEATQTTSQSVGESNTKAGEQLKKRRAQLRGKVTRSINRIKKFIGQGAEMRKRIEKEILQVRKDFDFSVNLSPGFKNEFYPLQRGFRSFVNSAWISRGFRVDTNKC